MLILIAAGIGTALATGLGAIPVFFLGERAAILRPALLGLAAGRDDGGFDRRACCSPASTRVSAVGPSPAASSFGVCFLLDSPQRSRRAAAAWARARSEGLAPRCSSSSSCFVHSLPEGFAIGTAYASDTRGAEPLRDPRDRDPEHPRGHQRRDPDGRGRVRSRPAVLGGGCDQRAAAGRRGRSPTCSSRQIKALLPFSFGFAAGAMLALVVVELLPQALRGNRRAACTGAALRGRGDARPQRSARRLGCDNRRGVSAQPLDAVEGQTLALIGTTTKPLARSAAGAPSRPEPARRQP